LNEFGEKQAAQKSMLLEMEARLEKMNSADAVRKSGEVEEASKETVQKNTIWSPGAFSGKKQFFSANDL
jgi:hypothetical protein